MLAAAASCGWGLRPDVATPEMLFEMGQAADFHIPRGANRATVYAAMIAAAPKVIE